MCIRDSNWVELHPAEHPETLTAQALQTIVREAGIVGMGGATFPTQVKICLLYTSRCV